MRKKRPSAPMVLSIIAVVFSLAGTGAASVATISVLSKKEKKQTRNIAKDEINKAAPGLSVANATNAASLGGQPASFYAPATTLRTAFVAGNGTVDPAHSDGVSSANVTQPVARPLLLQRFEPGTSHRGGLGRGRSSHRTDANPDRPVSGTVRRQPVRCWNF